MLIQDKKELVQAVQTVVLVDSTINLFCNDFHNFTVRCAFNEVTRFSFFNCG